MSIVLLAKNLGLSISTVSRALNGYDDVSAATRERVVLRAKAIGYRPNPSARRLGAGKTSAIGVILPAASSTGQAVDSMYSSLLCGVVTEIEPAGYHLLASMQAKHDAAREAAAIFCHAEVRVKAPFVYCDTEVRPWTGRSAWFPQTRDPLCFSCHPLTHPPTPIICSIFALSIPRHVLSLTHSFLLSSST
jgi:DNA-binding LacI/PurR family transcriptional regulator